MGEIKSVKVDNWGVFFLQKLQNFFNKTDYCDLTLQFNDNSQLKVHRLVLSACTDYFNVLENTYETNDDTLIMPKDLQADVVVPIVNFMYTGTLEFEYNMYDRLFRTAREMNMTVLLKLLEAHRKTAPTKPVPVLLNRSIGRVTQQKVPFPQSYPVRPVERTYSSPAQRKNAPVSKTLVDKSRIMCVPKVNVPETIAIVSKYRHVESKTGPSRFDPTDEEILPDSFESFNTISYESKPLITADQIKEEDTTYDERPSTSTFEQLRKGYTNQNKRPAPKITSPLPSKKPNLQDVKEYTEAHRLRKQLEAEEDTEDDPTYYDDSHFSDDDDDPLIVKKKPIKSYEKASKSQSKTVTKNDDDSSGTKDNAGSVHHAKIISEVLKQYPHLVKNIKNIKLKIMQKTPPKPEVSTKVVTVQKAPLPPPPPPVQPKTIPVPKSQPKKIDSKTMHALIAKGAENMTGPWLCLRCGVGGRPISIPSYKSFRRHLTNVHNEKIDQRLCEHCGYKSQRKNDLIHHMLIEHNIKMTSETVYPKCTYCEHIAIDAVALKKHTAIMHRSKVNVETNKKEIQHCIYCNKVFSKEVLLYAHMRANHKEKAREDGVMDFSDDEQSFDEADKYVPNDPLIETSVNKIKILSNISLPSRKAMPFAIDPSSQTISQISGKASQPIVNLEPSSEAEALSNVASGIATSLGLVEEEEEEEEEANSPFHDENQILPNQFIEQAMANVHGEFDKKDVEDSSEHLLTKLVTADGAELELTASQKEEIISQLQGQNANLSENVVMVLNQDNFDENTEIINSNQNIVVVYSQADNVIKENFMETEQEGDPLESTQTVVEEETVEETNVDWQTVEEQMAQDDEINKNDEDEKKSDDDKNESMDKSERENEKDGEPVDEIKSKTINKDDDSDKLKLISALEGEWSEDEEEKTKEQEKSLDDSQTERKDDEEILFEATTTPNESGSQSKDFSEKDHKNLSKIMGEWDDENVKEETKEVQEVIIKKENKETNVKKEVLSQEKIIEEKTNNPELKTLINDWGDDEDDGDL